MSHRQVGVRDIDLDSRRGVLNPFSHETVVPGVSAEIEGAIYAVEAWRKLP